MPEQIEARPPQCLEEPFHIVGGEHRCGLALNGPGVALTFFDTVKGDQMAARAIQEETVDLLENLTNRLALGGLADGGEESLQVRIQSDSTQIPHNQAQATTACQDVVSNIDVVDNGLGIYVFCSIVLHLYLPTNGLLPRSGKDLYHSFHTSG
jgi:hypothetical protein